MEMEMRAAEDITMAEDLTPPLPPLSFSLHDTYLSSHCSACSVPLPTPPFSPIFPPNHSHVPSTPTLLYCSPFCSALDSRLHFSSAEHHLLQSFSPSTSHPDSACLRLSLRLLYLLPLLQNENVVPFERIGGLVTNYRRVIQAQGDDEVLGMVKEGARDMVLARRMMLDGSDSITLMAEAVICVVMMNAVEVQDKNGRAIGIAVYDTSFSWINHSCSPNSCYRFSTGRSETGGQLGFLISPATAGDSCGAESLNNTLKHQKSKCLDGIGPRIIVRSIKEIKKGEEVTIAYTDLLQPKATRQSELWLKYRFNCCCKRCRAIPATYVDYVLQEPSVLNDEELKDWFDNAIGEYISFSNPVSCCEKLENLLTNWQHVNEPSILKDQETPLNLLHHLSLNTYTTLGSVYKVLACDLLALDPQNNKLQMASFYKIKASAAYSLLLAVLTHHLFLSEYSLVAFAADYWESAGESILSVGKSSVWESSFGLAPPVVSEASSFLNHDESSSNHQSKRFFTNLFSDQHPILEFEDASKQFQINIGDGITKTWSFLTHEGSSFLKLINDLDICCFLTMGASSDSEVIPTIRNQKRERNVSVSELECSSQMRGNLFQLGSHCLVYAAFLSSICYGEQSDLVTNALNFLNSESITS